VLKNSISGETECDPDTIKIIITPEIDRTGDLNYNTHV
jgi:hypothetical protein